MNIKIVLYLLMGLTVTLVSCVHQTQEKGVDSTQIVSEVNAQVVAFHAADTSLNADKVIDLLWPEFTMLADGHYITYEDVKKGSRAFMSSLNTFNTKWNDMRITPLGNQHALSSFIFSDSLVTKDGTISQSMGPNTFIWEKRDGIWKVLFADADHYPLEKYDTKEH